MKRKLWRILQRLQYFGKFVKVSQADIIAKMGFVTKDTTNKLERERNGLTREVGMERERERERNGPMRNGRTYVPMNN